MFDVSKIKIENTKQLLNGRVLGEVVGYDAQLLTASGDNYLSLVLKVDLRMRRGDKIETVETVAKFVPPGEIQKGKTEMSSINFRNEIVWYRDVVPVLAAFEKECGVTGYTSIYPKYYGGRLNLSNKLNMADEHAVVMLEYLKDYKIGDRHEGLDLETSKMMLKVLARFHALPIALKLKKPQFFKEKVLPMLGQQAPPPPELENGGFNIDQIFLEAIKQDHEFDHLISRIANMLKVDPFHGGNPREPWSTICHNDFWVNNFMINPQNGDVKVLDFQITTYKSVAVDVLFFLFSSVTSPVVNTNFRYLLKYYYDQFIEALHELGVNTTPFTYDSYVDEMKLELRDGQLGHACIFTCILKREKGTGPDMVMGEKTPDAFKDLMNVNAPGVKQKIWDIVKICNDMKWI